MPAGSPEMAKTIGMADVACFAAGTALPTMTMTATLSRTSSAAISATTVHIRSRWCDPRSSRVRAAAAFRSSSPTTPAAQRISEDKRRLAGGPAELGHLITFDPRDEPVVHAIDPQWRQDVICGAVHISPA
jgi:hypothetical protein